MILIADSGSTKTDWIIIDDELNIHPPFATRGLNPNILNAAEIEAEVKSSSEINAIVSATTNVFFYGAGCTGNGVNIVDAALKNIFPAAGIKIKSDLLAAAHATCWNKSGII